MRKTVLFMVVLVFLSACAAPTPEPTSTPTPTATVAPTATQASSMPEYAQKMTSIIDTIQKASDDQQELFQMAGKDISLLEDSSWISLVDKNLDDMEQAANDIYTIEQIPPEAIKLHKIFIDAADEILLVVLYERQFLENGDSDSATKTGEHIQKYAQLLHEANLEMQEMMPK